MHAILMTTPPRFLLEHKNSSHVFEIVYHLKIPVIVVHLKYTIYMSHDLLVCIEARGHAEDLKMGSV